MLSTGRQAPWAVIRPWFVAGTGAIVLMAGYATVQRHRHSGHYEVHVGNPATSAATGVRPARSAPHVNPPPTIAAKLVASAAIRQSKAAADAAPKPSFDVVRVDVSGAAVFAGRGAPGAKVTIRDDGRALGAVTADGAGQWVFVPSVPLDPGGRELSLSEHTPDGSEVKSDGDVLLLVPDRGKTAGAVPLAVLEPNKPTGRGTLRLLQPPPPVGLGAGAHLGLDLVQYDDSGAIRFAGSAPPGMPIRLYVDNRRIGDAEADDSGRWSLAPPRAEKIALGRHEVRVDQLNAKGRVSARVALPFTRDPEPEPEPEKVAGAEAVVVQPHENLWILAKRLYGSGQLYTVIYQANRAQIRDPRLIYPGQTFALPNEPPPTETPSAPTASGSG